MRHPFIPASLLLLAISCRPAEVAPASSSTTASTTTSAPGDTKRGLQLLTQYGCGTCHRIPGVDGSHGMLAPSLDHMATRGLIAGKFPNNPETMSRWLQNPQTLDPQTSMPNLSVTPADARDMSAYLLTLR